MPAIAKFLPESLRFLAQHSDKADEALAAANRLIAEGALKVRVWFAFRACNSGRNRSELATFFLFACPNSNSVGLCSDVSGVVA